VRPAEIGERPRVEGLPKVSDPCKSEKTGRIIDFGGQIAWIFLDKAI
jgi:hypothetical protein